MLRSTVLLRRIHPLLSFALPSSCPGCDEPLDALQLHGICSRCWAGFRAIRAGACRRCALDTTAPTDLSRCEPGLCVHCSGRSSPIEATIAAVVYDRRARSALLRAKLGRRPEILGQLARQVHAAVRCSGRGRDCSFVVAVPSHPLANLRRGFAPGTELARTLATHLDLPWVPALRRRFLPIGSAKRLGARDRLRLAKTSIRARFPLPAASILLVDDVMTTGATSEACAAALRRAGANAVVVAVWARAPRGGP